MSKPYYYIALIECDNDKFDQVSGDILKAAMANLIKATEGRGQTEIYQVIDEKAFKKFQSDSRKGMTHA